MSHIASSKVFGSRSAVPFAPLISLGQTNCGRLEALAIKAGRTLQAMIPFVLRDGLNYCENVVRQAAEGLADANARHLVSNDRAMKARGRVARKYVGRVKIAA